MLFVKCKKLIRPIQMGIHAISFTKVHLLEKIALEGARNSNAISVHVQTCNLLPLMRKRHSSFRIIQGKALLPQDVLNRRNDIPKISSAGKVRSSA